MNPQLELLAGPLAGRVAIVTGGSRGLGEAYVQMLVEEGARVVVADLLETEGRALVDHLGERATFRRLNASKWAVRGLTKAAALDLAPYGIRVHVVVPGPFLTPMTEPFHAELTELVKSQPVQRIGDPPEAARLIRYLILEATYSTGSEFFVDGGAMTGMSLPTPGE